MSRVTDDVMRRVASAIDRIAADPEMPCTKRAIERSAGLSHDAVARAFRQDRTDGSEFDINTRFDRLIEARRGRRSVVEQQAHDAKRELRDARRRIAELEADLDAHAQVILAQHLELAALRDSSSDVVPIRRRRGAK